MTENKRFKVTDNTNNPYLSDWNVTDYADGGIVHHPMTSENMANVICDLLNELYEEKQHIESVIKEAYQTERTAIGKNVLKQLCENLEIGDD